MKGYHDNYSVTIQVFDRKVVVIETCTASIYIFVTPQRILEYKQEQLFNLANCGMYENVCVMQCKERSH